MRFIDTLVNQFQDHLERRRNLPFLKACMAACAMVASADGDVSFAERVRVDQILETLNRLKVFDPHEGVNIFNDFTDAILANSRKGHGDALKFAIEGTPDPESRELLIRVCLAVSEMNTGPDGTIPMTEQVEIVSLCSQLGVEARDCGLYIDKADGPLV